eukprot:TRINITY_DN2157_c0_g1_i3.p1 TRINITY_DN2157_c0_g1~~TRINITY_DN2157_c0_g1_i3.p1  ORF type:complete len:545 (+),score=127.94 TRINITY_DN2157_c0_g1_i3:66-1637(+)
MGRANQRKGKQTTPNQKLNHQKKAQEHQKRQKNAHNAPKAKKDPGLPNLAAFKGKFDRMLEKQRGKEGAAEKQTEKEKRRAARQAHAGRAPTSARGQNEVNENVASNKKTFYRELKKLLEAADVIIQVLDARDPEGCRCRHIEQKILGELSQKAGSQKKIILVLNKIDLVPADVVADWVRYLRREFPTIAFKASTQDQRSHIAHASVGVSLHPQKHGSHSAASNSSAENALQSNKCVGGDALLQLLKNYCRSKDAKTSIAVGIIGYPNVGKSSIVNSLKRSRAVGVAPTPGFTKSLQEVRLDKQVKLIDSPGVIFSSAEDDPGLLLRNCIRIEQLEDPLGALQAVLDKFGLEQLKQFYKLPLVSTPEAFLLAVAQAKGKLQKGGVADVESAARAVLQDWNNGKIPFYTRPPHVAAPTETAQVVSAFSEEFDVDQLLEESNAQAIASMPIETSESFMAMTSSERPFDPSLLEDSDDENKSETGEAISDDEDDDEEGDDEELDEAESMDNPTPAYFMNAKKVGSS